VRLAKAARRPLDATVPFAARVRPTLPEKVRYALCLGEFADDDDGPTMSADDIEQMTEALAAVGEAGPPVQQGGFGADRTGW
jgi:hypothetical protein